MSKRKLFIIEEHHEAFFIWNYAIKSGMLPNQNNTILHIDEHSDSDVPRFNTSINELNGSWKQLFDFTYNELTISNFIFPSFYLGIANKLYNISQIHDGKSRKKELKEIFVRSRNGDGKILLAGKANEEIILTKDPDRKTIIVNNQTLEDEIPIGLQVILDIDLDFFSCDENPNQFRDDKIEITFNEYQRYLDDRYHFARISPNGGSAKKVEEIDGKYYLKFFDYPYLIPSRFKVTEDEIVRRINQLKEYLVKFQINPTLIDVCRSKFSAYTPIDQAEFINNELLTMLKEIYDLEILTIDEILYELNLDVKNV